MKTNPHKDNLLGYLMNSAYNLYLASLCAGPPIIDDLRKEILNPKPGDIVMETSTFRLPGHDKIQGIGTLLSIDNVPVYSKEKWLEMDGGIDEKIPEKTVYVIALIFGDGRKFTWENASFIKVKTDLTRY